MAREPALPATGAPASPPNTPPSLTGSSLQDPSEVTRTNAGIPYSPTFSDALMKRIISQPTAPRRSTAASSGKNAKEDGIRVLPPSSTETPARGASIRLQDIDPTSLPNIDPDELPLSLDDPRRVYASGVPGVRLTHPGGWLEGGTGPSVSSMTPQAAAGGSPDSSNDAAQVPPEFIRAFVEQHDITTPAALRSNVNSAIAAQVEELKRCMLERRDAIEKNDKVQREIADLVAERDMERRVHERLMKVRREKMEEQETVKMQDGSGA